jgi:hypothetical protein
MVRGKSARILTRRSCWRPISVVRLPRLARSLSSSRRRASYERNATNAIVAGRRDDRSGARSPSSAFEATARQRVGESRRQRRSPIDALTRPENPVR